MIYFVVALLMFSISDYNKPIATLQTESDKKHVIIGHLESSDWNERLRGLVLINDDDLQDEEIKNQIISLLEEENKAFLEHLDKGVFEPYQSEGYEAYYDKLIYLVGQTRDRRAIPALIGVLNRASGSLIENSLAEFGEPAAQALLRKVNDPIIGPRVMYCFIAIINKDNLIEGTISDSTRHYIRDLMLDKSKFGEYYVRLAALQVLGEFSEPEVLKHLQDIAENDPTYVEREISGKTVRRYPIREEAQTQLDKHKRE